MRYTQSTNIPTYKSSNSLQCRFVDYQPAKISALAFSHPSNSKQPTPASLLLAVGRSNGDIELWSPLYEWVHKTVPPLSLARPFLIIDSDRRKRTIHDAPSQLKCSYE